MIESVIHLRYGQVVCQINYITLITGKYKVSISSCVNFFFSFNDKERYQWVVKSQSKCIF